MKQVSINTDYITVSAFLKWCGAAETGGDAKNLIVSQKVSVNGEICTMRGKKLREGDIVAVGKEGYRVTK